MIVKWPGQHIMRKALRKRLLHYSAMLALVSAIVVACSSSHELVGTPETPRSEQTNGKLEEYELVTSWGEPGDGPGQFRGVGDLAINSVGQVIVADARNARVQVFSPNGDFVHAFSTLGVGEDLTVPSLTLGGGDEIWLHEYDLHDLDPFSVKRFTAEGELLAAWGEYGEEPQQLLEGPSGQGGEWCVVLFCSSL